MKNKFLAFILIIVLIMACSVGIGCSKASCTYTACSKCGNCAAKTCEQCGDTIDCSDFLFNCLMGENCHDKYCVGCWYNCGDTCRNGRVHETDDTCAGCNRCWNCYKDDLSKLSSSGLGYNSDICSIKLEKSHIKNLSAYFYLTVTVTVTLPSDIKDLFIVFDVKEVLTTGSGSPNYDNDVLLFITDSGKKGETFTASTKLTFTTGGESERYDNDYTVKVTEYYGKVN